MTIQEFLMPGLLVIPMFIGLIVRLVVMWKEDWLK